jgi:hypothetical protein
VYNNCKLLADYLGIDIYRLSIASDRFKRNPSIEQHQDEDEEDNKDDEDDNNDEEGDD